LDIDKDKHNYSKNFDSKFDNIWFYLYHRTYWKDIDKEYYESNNWKVSRATHGRYESIYINWEIQINYIEFEVNTCKCKIRHVLSYYL
jgi:hypothetical protein